MLVKARASLKKLRAGKYKMEKSTQSNSNSAK